MADIRDFVRSRRKFISALGGMGMGGLTLSLGATSKRETALDRFNDAISGSMCTSLPAMSTLRINPATLPKDLTFVGTRLLKLGFMDEVAQLYMKRTGNQVRVIGDGCDGGLVAARTGKAHFGELCCPVQDSPAAGMCWLPVAQDMKVVLTSPDNLVDDISLANLRKVAIGEIQNWRELGGADRPIVFIVHNHCPPYLEPVRTVLLNGGKIWSKHAMRSNTDSDHLRHLVRFRPTLGVDSWVLAAPYVKKGQLKVLSVDGVMPSVRSVSRGAYPLTGPLNLIFALWMDDLMRPFLDFIYSEDAQRIIARNTVPVSGTQAAKLGNAPEYLHRPKITALRG
jgi:phosphate transport system substrate-binding protein